jgi:nitrite reductase/ring-hydroxylating ferredoxin subunit
VARELIVGPSASLAEGKTVKFSFAEDGQPREGFVIRHRGRLYAYRNECRHIPMTMDWVENRFLSRDHCFIQCATHGALYQIDTGLCVEGPPAGEFLKSFPVEVRDDQIVVIVPGPS